MALTNTVHHAMLPIHTPSNPDGFPVAVPFAIADPKVCSDSPSFDLSSTALRSSGMPPFHLVKAPRLRSGGAAPLTTIYAIIFQLAPIPVLQIGKLLIMAGVLRPRSRRCRAQFLAALPHHPYLTIPPIPYYHGVGMRETRSSSLSAAIPT